MPSSSSDTGSHYRGRFAPSPTGPLHFGSLVSAVISYLDARSHKGKWLLRIEDIDPPREVVGAADTILRQLEAHGLQWDEPVLYQSQRYQAYAAALALLREQALLYPCSCSRQQLREQGGIHTLQCQRSDACLLDEHALRVRVPPGTTIQYVDRLQGPQREDIAKTAGDFVLKRKDGLYAYQLAVVVDDEFQQITHIVRGSDLLSSTPRQMYLQQQLGSRHPEYAHHPVVLNDSRQKLSKQNLAPAVGGGSPSANLQAVFSWLNIALPNELQGASCETLLAWAGENWRLASLRGVADKLQ